MANVFDVAVYILENLDGVTAMKLQKLVYYSQAWSLVWDESPLFNEPIKAWAHGPVCSDLYEHHRGMFKVSASGFSAKGRSENLEPHQKETIDKVLAFYGDKDSHWLSDLTHQEDPWLDSRRGLSPMERSNNEITHASMAEYYGSL